MKPVCQPEVQEFPVMSPENRPRAAWAARNKDAGHARPSSGSCSELDANKSTLRVLQAHGLVRRERRELPTERGALQPTLGSCCTGTEHHWWPQRRNIGPGRNYFLVTALHGCHMCNKQVMSVVTCFTDICSTGKPIKIDNTPMRLLFLGHVFQTQDTGRDKTRTSFSTSENIIKKSFCQAGHPFS